MAIVAGDAFQWLRWRALGTPRHLPVHLRPWPQYLSSLRRPETLCHWDTTRGSRWRITAEGFPGTPRREERGVPGKSLLEVGTVLGVATLALVAVACGGSGFVGDRVVVTQGVFRGLPLTAEEATREGWIQSGGCFPNMGIHYNLPGYALALLYNAGGDLIGFELDDVRQQPVPPWEHLPEGHVGMEFEHWSLHTYFADPARACG